MRVLDALVTVVLKPDYEPSKDVDQTLADYWTKVLAYRDDVTTLMHALELATLFEPHIHWQRFKRLINLEQAK